MTTRARNATLSLDQHSLSQSSKIFGLSNLNDPSLPVFCLIPSGYPDPSTIRMRTVGTLSGDRPYSQRCHNQTTPPPKNNNSFRYFLLNLNYFIITIGTMQYMITQIGLVVGALFPVVFKQRGIVLFTY